MSSSLPEFAKYPPALTVDQVAEILQIPPKTVYDLGARGKLPRVKLGRIVRFPLSGIIEILNPKPRFASVTKSISGDVVD